MLRLPVGSASLAGIADPRRPSQSPRVLKQLQAKSKAAATNWGEGFLVDECPSNILRRGHQSQSRLFSC